jgi:mucin-19
MPISFVAAGAVATGSNPTVAYPAGDIQGDLLVLVTTGTATPLVTPTGWTQRYAQGANRFITVFTRYVGNNSEPNSVNLSLAGTSSKAVMLCYRGAGSYDVVGTVATGTSTSAATVSQTTTYNNDYVLSIFARTIGASTFTVPASTTSRVNSSSTASINGLLLVDELQAAAGASAVRTSTLSASGAWSAINISFVDARTLYWVLGNGTWDTTTTGNWANTSNGSPTGILPPAPTENVIIDSNSGTGTITCSSGVCNDLTVTASQAIVLGQTASTLAVSSNISFPAGGSFSVGNASFITLDSGSAKTITTNGKAFSNLTFDGSGGNWTLPSALTATATLALTRGTITLSTNTTTLTCREFSSSNGNTRAIAFGTGNITTTGSGTAWTTATATNLTYTGTPTVNISNNSASVTTVTAHTTGGTATNTFDFNFTTGTYALTLTTGSIFRSLNFTGFTGSWAPGTATYTFYGNITLVAGMTFTPNSGGNWTILNGSNVTAGGKTLSPITFNAAGQSLTFSAGTTTVSGTFTLTAGTLALATNGSSLSCNAFSSSGNGVRAINFGTGSITTTGSGTVWDVGTASNLTYTGTPTVNISNNSAVATTISTHGIGGTAANVFDFNITTGTYTLTIPTGTRFRSLNFTGFAGSYSQNNMTIFGNFTASSGMTYIGSINDLIFSATSGVQLITSAGRTLGSISQNGVGGTVRLVNPTTIGSGFTYFLTNGTLDLGTNTASLTCGSFSSNNTNIRQIQFGTASITCLTWDTTNATNFTYTGTPNVNLSSGARDAQIHEVGETEANVLNFNVSGTGSLNIGNNGALRSLNCTGYTGSWSPGPDTYDFYGNITLVSGMTLTTGTGTWNLLATSGTQTITSGGRTMFALTQNGVGGTVSLGDALSLAGTYTLTNGTFNANNQNLTASTFSSNNTNIRTITMGSGTWSLSGTGSVWNVSGANLTLNVNTSTIVLSDTSTTAKTFAGDGKTYNNLTLGDGAGITTYTITGANTFNTLATNKSVSSTIVLPASTTTTATTFSVNGSIYNPIALTSSTSGTQATLNVSNIFTSNYVVVADNNLTSANGTVTNGLLGANTTGWTVGAGSSFYRLLTATTQTTFTIPSNWTSANNSIHVIGGGGGGAGGTYSALLVDRSGGGGGGGGGYARLSNVTYTPGSNIPYRCGAGGALGTGSLVDATDGGTSYWNLTTTTIAFVSSQLSTQIINSTTITVTTPTVSSGNLMVMIVNSSNIGNTWTTPSGWTRGTDSASARAVFYKTAEPSEPASYVVTQSGSNTADGVILVYSNATWDKNGVNTANAATVTPSADVNLNGSAVIFCGFDNGVSRSFSTPTGYTLRQSDSDATAPSLTVFDILGISTSAPYTAPTSTVTGGNARAFLVVLSPTVTSPTLYASGGGGGKSTPTTSTGGVGGIGFGGTVNTAGGTGGVGGSNGSATVDAGGGGGGGAAGPNGNGGNGGNGAGTPYAGGGGGNGGGTAGGNAVASTSSGNGGNTAGGYGGGVQPNGPGFGGGGGAGGTTGGVGSNGVDILSVASLGSGGGAGASSTANNTATAGLYGAGGGGGSGDNNNGTNGAQGAIILVWGTISPISQNNYFLLF